MDRISTPIHQGTNLSAEESVEIDNAILAAAVVVNEYTSVRERAEFAREWYRAQWGRA